MQDQVDALRQRGVRAAMSEVDLAAAALLACDGTHSLVERYEGALDLFVFDPFARTVGRVETDQ
jgi:hypothetical protein